MKRQDSLKKLVSAICVASSLFLMASPVFAETTAPVAGEEASTEAVTRNYEYEWKYTAIDGRVHKRLWNCTLGRWEGDWIPC